MAVLVLCAQPSGRPGGYAVGDVIEVLEDGQHPGSKAALDPRFMFIKVEGSRKSYQHLKAPLFEVSPILDPDTGKGVVTQIAKRGIKSSWVSKATAKQKGDALDWSKKVDIGLRSAFEATLSTKASS